VKKLIALFYERIVKYALKFGTVGLIAFFIDLALFNLLRVGVFGTGHALQSPLGASAVSIAVATLFTWVANRYWTFREHRRRNYILELFEFLVVAAGGMAINLGCVWFSHYVLGFTSLLADNVAKNVVGLGFATLFRFLMYRFWVYGAHRKDGLTAVRHREAEAGALSIYEDTDYVMKDIESLTGTIRVASPTDSGGTHPGRDS
jgi:putative flippase GtrA